MNPLWETIQKIRAFDVDANDRLKVNTILDYFQDAASNHAEELKVGYSDLIPKGFFWVLSWAKLEFIDYAKFMDIVKIQTWGKKQFKLFSMRDFMMMDLDDNVLCKATTAWLLLDAKSLRPKLMPQLFPEIKMNESKEALANLPKKIVPTQQTEIMYTTQVRYSDVDMNQHANNAIYIELMLNCFDKEFHKAHTIKLLVVSFKAESKYGDEILLCKGTEKENPLTHFVEAKNLNTEKIVFQAFIEWIKS